MDLIKIKETIKSSLNNIDSGIYRGEKKRLVSSLNSVDIDALVYATMFGLEKGLEGLPLVTVCVITGAKALGTIDFDDSTTEQDEIRKFFAGYHLQYEVAKLGLTEFIKGDFTRAPYKLIPTEENVPLLRELIVEANLYKKERIECPTTSEPEPYESFHNKGSGDLVHNTSEIVKFQIELDLIQGEPKYVEIINDQQTVPMKVNIPLLKIVKECTDDNLFTNNHKRMSKKAKESVIASYNRVISDSDILSEDRFFEKYHYDYRGRIYSRSANLDYGGSKLAKGLFMFSNAEPLGPKGWEAILVHAANCWGEDKKTLKGRMDFADDEFDKWMLWANDPLKYKGKRNRQGKVAKEGWQVADEPWEFLASILELKAATDSGDEFSYISGLPVSIDCSCSGLQVLTLLTNCDISAPLCNLIEENKRGDFYLAVADSIFSEKRKYTKLQSAELDAIIDHIEDIRGSKRKMKEYSRDNAKMLSSYAEQFWDGHYDKRRSIVKRSSMTFLYSCGIEEMSKHIFDDHKTDKSIKGLNTVFAFCLAFKIYKACGDLLPGPVSAMNALMEVGRREHRKDRDFSCKGVFTGFPFIQEYRVDVTRQFETTYFDRKIKFRLRVDKVRTDRDAIEELERDRNKRLALAVDERHTKNIKKLFKNLIKSKDSEKDACCGISPNFVHLQDSQVLAKAMYLSDFDVKTVHDSVACIPSNMHLLSANYREAFNMITPDVLMKIFKDKGYVDLIKTIKLGKMNGLVINEFGIS